MTMQVVNRKGEREDVRFDAILEKLSGLSNGLDTNWVDAANLTKLTIEGLYDGVTTARLDQLAAETAASLASHHQITVNLLLVSVLMICTALPKQLSPKSLPILENLSTLSLENMLR